MNITRRQLIGGALASVAAPTILTAAQAAEKGTRKGKKVAIAQLKNEDFYKDGVYNVEAGKKAYYDMMNRFRYPIVPRLKTDEFWAVDFGVGSFATVGLGGIMWINNLAGDYFGHEIYLLPGQMIAEHRHMKTAKAGPKMEGWQVRYGSIWIFGEGEPTPGWEKIVPQAHQGDYLKCRNYRQLLPGECGDLAGPEQWHFMVAGPEGAIVTEYATYHDGDGLRFTHSKAKL